MYIYSNEEISKIISITKKYEAKNILIPSFLFINAITMYFAGIYMLYTTSLFSNIFFKINSVTLMSLLIVRNFMIFHDLGHCNYFPSNERKNNNYGINTVLCETFDIIFFYPGESWRLGHREHHRVHGNIDHQDDGRTITMSTIEYNNSSKIYKVMYDIFRYPLIFFILFPVYVFFLHHIKNREGKYFLKMSLLLTFIYNFFNYETLILFIYSLYFSSFMGLILFHFQHSINDPYWKSFDLKNDYNSKMNAELNGSSVLNIPYIFKLFTNGIEYHNVHHINPAVPSYNIKKCYEELKEKKLIKNREVKLSEMIESLTYTIYDVNQNKYVNHYSLN